MQQVDERVSERHVDPAHGDKTMHRVLDNNIALGDISWVTRGDLKCVESYTCHSNL